MLIILSVTNFTVHTSEFVQLHILCIVSVDVYIESTVLSCKRWMHTVLTLGMYWCIFTVYFQYLKINIMIVSTVCFVQIGLRLTHEGVHLVLPLPIAHERNDCLLMRCLK